MSMHEGPLAHRLYTWVILPEAHIVEYTVSLLGGFITFYVLLLQSLSAILFILGVGVILVALRLALIFLGPFISTNAKYIAFFVNVAVDILNVVLDAIELAVNVVLDIVDALSGKHYKIDYTHIASVSAHSIQRFISYVLHTCTPYNNVEFIAQKTLYSTVGTYTCPVVRAATPLPYIGTLTKWLLGWTSADPTPLPGNNCDLDDDNQWVCVGIAAGILDLEVLLPMFFISILLIAFGKHLWKLLITCVEALVLVPVFVLYCASKATTYCKHLYTKFVLGGNGGKQQEFEMSLLVS